MCNRVTTIFIFLFLALAVYGQEQKRVAILGTEDDGDSPLEYTNLTYLTGRLREIALKTLPENKYLLMTAQSIIDKLGSKEKALQACKEAQCLAEIGRRVSADYVCQARLGRFGDNLTISMELYHSAKGNLIGSFTGKAKDVLGLEAVIDEKAPSLFDKILGASVSSKSPSVAGGIGGIQTAGQDYELNEKRYLVNLNTEPSNAVLSFDGAPSTSCTKTPCKLELAEGSVRIVAALEQYERADTTVFIKQNNQNVIIKLKSNFGFLEIKPAYLDGIGKDEPWSLTINGKRASSLENRLSPNKYKVELSHRCYEILSFEAGINKGRSEIFDMSAHIKLKKGGLALSAEKNGEPVSEPVFVNGKRVGETPFSSSVPLCAKVEIGNSREMVDVKLKYNEKVKYTYKGTDLNAQRGPEISCSSITGICTGPDKQRAKECQDGLLISEVLYDKCKRIGKGSAGYEECYEDYKAQAAKNNQVCSGKELENTPKSLNSKSIHWYASNDIIEQVLYEKLASAGIKKTKCSGNGIIAKLNKPSCKTDNVAKIMCTYSPKLNITDCNDKLIATLGAAETLKSSPQTNENAAKEELANILRSMDFSYWVSSLKKF